jgi:putative peptidoglycan lipid II flippase
VAANLNDYERFRALALGQHVPNVLIVVCVVLLHQRLGIASQGMGVVLGAVAYVLVLLPFFTRVCGRRSPGDGPIAARWWWRLPAARQVGRGLVPLLLVGLADWGAGQWAVYRPITSLSMHNPGALLEFGSAYRVLQIPTGILVAALLTVLLPLLSEYASAGDTGGLAGAAVSGMRMVLFVVAPTAICLGCLALPILNVLYLHGRYLEHEVALSTPLIAVMAPFVVLNAVSEVLILVLLATRRVWLLLVLQAASLAIAAGLCRGMAALWGLLGLAAAVSLTAFASMGLLFWGVGVTVPLARALVRGEPVRLGRGAMPGAGREDLGAFAWKMGIVSIGLWLFLFAFTHAWGGAGGIQGPRRNIQEVAFGMAAAFAMYAGMAQGLRIPEWLALRDMLINR